ncbi:MAG: sialidase family protein [Anaerolineales bacterium]|jgi:hypothetical protein
MSRNAIIVTRIGITASLIILLFPLWISDGKAQELNGWSSPFHLSAQSTNGSEAFMVSDQYGYVHVFWVANSKSINAAIMYTRFDGNNWTSPVDIMLVQPGGYTIGYIGPAVDRDGILHLVWTGGNNGPAYYAYAPAANALSARDWSVPIRIDIPAYRLKLLVEGDIGMHILFSNYYGSKPGIYYTRSQDDGVTWSQPLWLDPDIPAGHRPGDLKFAMDDSGGIHAAWLYMEFESGVKDMIRYAHSLNDPEQWSPPVTIDEADESDLELRQTNVGMIVQGQTVHIIWAGTESTNREHRYSTNAGLSWNETRRIFGNLQGEAIGDGLAVDAKGRMHFVGQIRWPQAIWHAVWDQGWTDLAITYLIAHDAFESKGSRIHAHNVRLVVRAGNQLVMTFTSSPGEGPLELYAMHRTLEDVSPVEIIPTPPLNSPSTEESSEPELPLPAEVITTSIIVDNNPVDTLSESNTNNSQNGFWIGVYPALAIVIFVIVVQQLRKN